MFSVPSNAKYSVRAFIPKKLYVVSSMEIFYKNISILPMIAVYE